MNTQNKPQPLTVDDLQDLYGELRGSRSAGPIMDARAFFLERQYAEAFEKLDEAYQTYRESRMRILRQVPENVVDAKAKDRDRQIRRLKRKQEKARELIERFEDYLPQLQRLADKDRARAASKPKTASTSVEPGEASGQDASAQPSEPPSEAPPASDTAPAQPNETVSEPPALVTPDAIDESFRKQFNDLIGDRQLDLISGRFGFAPLADVTDVQPNAIYLLRKSDRCLLLRTEADPEDPESFTCVNLCSEKSRTTLTRQQMVQMSVKRRLVRLVDR